MQKLKKHDKTHFEISDFISNAELMNEATYIYLLRRAFVGTISREQVSELFWRILRTRESAGITVTHNCIYKALQEMITHIRSHFKKL